MPDNDKPFSDPTNYSESWVFRERASCDEAAIREIFRQANLSVHSQSQGASQAPSQASFQATTVSNDGATAIRVHICERNREVVGVLQWRQVEPEAEILDLAVAQANRRQGHATFLLERFLQLAAKNGIREVFLEVRESNAAAIALYTNFGFSRSGRRPNFYNHPTEAALLLKRKLTG
jgi:ribosomal-protein-alanine N-acetyltransferase